MGCSQKIRLQACPHLLLVTVCWGCPITTGGCKISSGSGRRSSRRLFFRNFLDHGAPDAKPVVKVARRLAGKNVDDAVVSLRKAAVECRATLTPHGVAMQRAAGAARRLDEYLTSLKGTGVLKEFARTYKRRRIAAAERGKGFMSYKVAELRFKRALIPLLMNGGKPAVGASLFAAIFDN